LTPVIIDPLFNAMFKSDAFYTNSDATKYSMKKIDESYNLYSEGIKKKFKGYDLDKNFLVVNKEDKEIELTELKDYLLTKIISNNGLEDEKLVEEIYEAKKEYFFGN
jgi:hypothetical protein